MPMVLLVLLLTQPPLRPQKLPAGEGGSAGEGGCLLRLLFCRVLAPTWFSGDLVWSDEMDLRDNELSPNSPSDSDTSFSSHVSPPLSSNVNKDSNGNNVMDVNAGNEQYSNGASSNDESKYLK